MGFGSLWKWRGRDGAGRERQVVGTLQCSWEQMEEAKGSKGLEHRGEGVCFHLHSWEKGPAGGLGMEPGRRKWRQEEGR